MGCNSSFLDKNAQESYLREPEKTKTAPKCSFVENVQEAHSKSEVDKS